MSSWLETYKPVASRRVQLLLAGLIWSIVGGGLICVGTYWVLSTSSHILGLLAISLCIGLGKSLLILDRVASQIVKRIDLRGEGRCLVSFYSLRVWAIVILMMLMGRILRGTGISYSLLGLIYAAVGSSLLISSRSIWLAWKDHPQTDHRD
jgi:Ca2+/Na+ antiporter